MEMLPIAGVCLCTYGGIFAPTIGARSRFLFPLSDFERNWNEQWTREREKENRKEK